jgi:hypothetical protein
VSQCSVETVEGPCDRPARSGGICWGHIKRRQRIKSGLTSKTMEDPLNPYGLPLKEQLEAAAVEYADAETRGERDLARDAVVRLAYRIYGRPGLRGQEGPWKQLERAILTYANADEDEDYIVARQRLIRAARSYCRRGGRLTSRRLSTRALILSAGWR